MTITTGHSALARLRQATAASHRELEGLVESLGMLESLEGFARHLDLMHAHCAAHEELLRGSPSLQLLVNDRRSEISTDLKRLSYPVQPIAPKQASPYTRAQCFGFTYVTEGSRLGSVVIARRLQSLGFQTRQLRSLQTSAAVVGARWSQFCQQLATLPDEEWDAAADAALESFEELKRAHLLERGMRCLRSLPLRERT